MHVAEYSFVLGGKGVFYLCFAPLCLSLTKFSIKWLVAGAHLHFATSSNLRSSLPKGEWLEAWDWNNLHTQGVAETYLLWNAYVNRLLKICAQIRKNIWKMHRMYFFHHGKEKRNEPVQNKDRGEMPTGIQRNNKIKPERSAEPLLDFRGLWGRCPLGQPPEGCSPCFLALCIHDIIVLEISAGAPVIIMLGAGRGSGSSDSRTLPFSLLPACSQHM